MQTEHCRDRQSGVAGTSGSTPPPAISGTEGLPGRTVSTRAEDGALIPKRIPLEWYASTIHDTELLMVNGDPSQALSNLDWTHFLMRCEGVNASVVGLSVLEAKLLSLVHLIAGGHDVFGRNFNYVPLTSFDTLKDLVEAQLRLLESVETASNLLRTAERTQTARLDAMRQAASHLNDFILRSDGEIFRLADRADRLQGEIGTLFPQLEALHHTLMQAEQSFRRAVHSQGDCLSFENLIKLGALIATVVSTAGVGAAAIGSAATAVQSLTAMESFAAMNLTWSTIKADYRTISKIVRPAGSDALAFARAFGDLQNDYRALFPDRPLPSTPDRSEDAVRLIAQKQDFDKAIEPYLRLPEARAYRELMRQYIGVAETRNNKILEYDRAISEIVQIAARVQVEKMTVDRLVSTTVENFDARLKENYAFLDSSLVTLKWNTIRHLVSMEKSLQFMTGKQNTTQYGDFSVAALQVSSINLIQRYTTALEDFGQESQLGERFAVPLSELLSQSDLDLFMQGQPVTLVLDSGEDDLFPHLYSVQTGRVGFVNRSGQVISGSLNISIQHQGRSVVRRQDGTADSFTHVPVTSSFVQNRFGEVSSRGDLLESATAGRGRYAGVSPYGPWRIRLNSATDTARAELREAVLTLNAFYRTMPI